MRVEKNSERSFKEPAVIKKMHESTLDRRTFLLRMALLTTSAAMPLSMCTPQKKKLFQKGRNAQILSEKEWQILIAVQDILFPSEDNAPGARELNAASFVQWVIGDKELDPEETAFLKNGLTWVDEEAVERWEKPFLELKEEEREKLLRHIETHSWGESWLSVMLMYIFEALLSDPLYGANPGGIGWNWLGYNPGQPRPQENKIYGNMNLEG